MEYPVVRRCFVVAGSSWAQIFSMVIGVVSLDADDPVPVWRRLHVLVDRAPEPEVRPDGSEAGTGERGDGLSMLAGDDDEPTADSLDVSWARFANNIINATSIAVRNSRATEVVFVVPAPLLVHLRPGLGRLLRLGVEPVEVPMNPGMWVSGTSRRHLGLDVSSPFLPAVGRPLPLLA